MASAFGVLRWSPESFWRATPRELAAAAGALRGAPIEAPTAGDLAALMREFPD
jgi:uncharacterized phage protein (TIGR02216 family)